MSTINDIAKETRLPVATVRRILRGDNKEVWPSAKERGDMVRRVAAELGYRRNTFAKATRTGRCGTIGLVMSDQPHRSDLPNELLTPLSQGLMEKRIHLIVSVLPDEKLTSEDFVPNILGELACDGLLVNYTSHVPSQLEQLIEHFSIPAIWLNADRAFDAIRPDDFDAASRATRELIAMGFSQVYYADAFYRFGEKQGLLHYSKQERCEGYRVTMAEAGRAPTECLPDGEDHLSCLCGLRELAKSCLRNIETPIAVLCYGRDEVEHISQASAEVGLIPGKDVVFATFGTSRPVTRETHAYTMYIPYREVARKGIQMLETRIENKKKRLSAQRVPFGVDPRWANPSG